MDEINLGLKIHDFLEFRMIVYVWDELSQEAINFIRIEEWVGVPDRKKQQMLLDLEDPRNMETTLHFTPGCDMIKIKLYRPESPTKMLKLVKWVLILGVADRLRQSDNNINNSLL